METLIKLYFNNGSLPPPYQFAYEMTFLKAGKVFLEFFGSEYDGHKKLYSEERAYDVDELQKIIKKVDSSPKIDQVMTGGAQRSITGDFESEKIDIEISADDAENIALFDQITELFGKDFSEIKEKITQK